ncbi:hypothetical protein BDR04DRAFT_1096608 [Suillus decipiens]|nr:hypothetical protein BDR04DRAFT_1096608 [Suillus decipiens]
MHVCLLPTEILLHIFTIHYQNGYDRLPPVLLAQLAVLARTCRKFKEPALDILWKHLQGFRPLFSCLLEGACDRDETGKLTLQRPPLAGEWGSLHQYARRVHSLTVNYYELDAIDNHIMQALMSASFFTSLFPNLRSLHWSDDREHFFPLLRVLLWPTITSLQVGLPSTPPSFAQSTLLVSLRGRCTSIRELSSVCIGDSAKSSDAIYETLSGLRELSHIDTGVLSPPEFLRLASLPSLKSLYFKLRTYDIHETQSNSTPTNFPKLDQVHIIASSQLVVEHFLRSVRLPSCRSAMVRVNYEDLDDETEDLYNPLDMPNLIVSFSECFSPALEKLHVEFESVPLRPIEEDIMTNPGCVFGFNALAPLLSFNRLTELQLDWIFTSAINDASLKTLAQSWPQLERFYFRSAILWLIPPSMTFTALVHLIKHCPRLHTVQMSFCADPVDYDNDPFFFETIPSEKITELSVGMSPIGKPCAVAYILLRLLPKLKHVVFDWLDDDEFVPLSLEHLWSRWSVVNNILAASNGGELR